MNVKYSFRSFLVDIGMNGETFRKTRDTLLDSTAGSSSYRSDEGRGQAK